MVVFLAAGVVADAFLVVAFAAVVVFVADDLTGVVLLAADVVAPLVAAFFVTVVLAGVDDPVVFFAVLFLAAGAFAAVVFLAAEVVVFLVAVFFVAVDAAAVLVAEPLVFLAALLVAAAALGSFFSPDTTALNSAPALNFGTAVFLARLRSPVRGLRTMREGRTTLSKAPKPVMATFSPRATSRVTVSRIDSSACPAFFLFPSKWPARASMS